MTSPLIARRWVPLVLVLVGSLPASSASAQSRIVSIEEHWELRIDEPDVATSAPQTTMVMSPTGNLFGQHFIFTINHETAPNYRPGGMQVQLWNGETMVEYEESHEYGTLSYDAEVIRWTQRMSLDDGTLKFEIDGTSLTWGQFRGYDVDLSTPTSLTQLNGYLPAVSLTESQVGYSENRVESLTLQKIRWVTDDGQVHEHNAPIPIDISLDP